MRLIATHNGYKYYAGIDENGKTWYNIMPENQKPPTSICGYGDAEYICQIKNVPNLF